MPPAPRGRGTADRIDPRRRVSPPNREVQGSATPDEGQFPLAVVLGCIDSRTPSELVFDAGLGEIFSVRIAGNVAREKVLGSLEYACAVAGAKLVVVMGHTSCGAVTARIAQVTNPGLLFPAPRHQHLPCRTGVGPTPTPATVAADCHLGYDEPAFTSSEACLMHAEEDPREP